MPTSCSVKHLFVHTMQTIFALILCHSCEINAKLLACHPQVPQLFLFERESLIVAATETKYL